MPPTGTRGSSTYVLPRLGAVSLRSLHANHLDDLYNHLLSGGSKDGGPLAPKTVHEAHLVVRNALDLAVQRDRRWPTCAYGYATAIGSVRP